eukprot:c44201_g1_i1 orf=41-691(+)
MVARMAGHGGSSMLHPPPLHSDSAAYASGLRRCANAKALLEGRRLHAQIIQTGHATDSFLGNLLVQMYGKCGALEDALAVFAKLCRRNVFSWTILIGAFGEQGRGKEVFMLFKQMGVEGVMPNRVTFISILSVCASQAAMVEGRLMHAYIVDRGFECDVTVGNALVHMYAKCGSLEDARRTFERMRRRDVVSWSVMIAAYAQRGHAAEALQLFRQM